MVIMANAKIVYASMTGNNEEIANIVAENLRELGIDVEINECTEVEAQVFKSYDICIVTTYTYGDGELPDEIKIFFEELGNVDLSGKVFGTCGSGDTFYEEFCKSVDDFTAKFIEAGATQGANSVKVNLVAEVVDIQNLKIFVRELVGHII